MEDCSIKQEQNDRKICYFKTRDEIRATSTNKVIREERPILQQCLGMKEESGGEVNQF